MKKYKKTYSAEFPAIPLGALSGGTTTFSLINNGRNNDLISLIWGFYITNAATGLLIPAVNNTDVIVTLGIYNINPLEMIGQYFTTVTPPAPTNSQKITIHNPGQYFFNDLFFSNGLLFELGYNNLSAGNRVINFDIAAEIEERSYFDND
jgi:hypothetical protein